MGKYDDNNFIDSASIIRAFRENEIKVANAIHNPIERKVSIWQKLLNTVFSLTGKR
jgi:hypothetical protein